MYAWADKPAPLRVDPMITAIVRVDAGARANAF